MTLVLAQALWCMSVSGGRIMGVCQEAERDGVRAQNSGSWELLFKCMLLVI